MTFPRNGLTVVSADREVICSTSTFAAQVGGQNLQRLIGLPHSETSMTSSTCNWLMTQLMLRTSVSTNLTFVAFGCSESPKQKFQIKREIKREKGGGKCPWL